MLNFFKNWVEFFFFVLMLVGVMVALLAPSAFISYVMIFLSGMLAGRLIYQRKNKIKLSYYIIIWGFLIGYLIGVYYGSRWISIALFVLGYITSYKLYDKKILKDIPF